MMAVKDAYMMICDAWILYRNYAASELTDENFERMVGEVEELRLKYNAPFASGILTATVLELGRIAKNREVN
ncbi:MAG: hypothetical protein ACLTLQ_19390 [[Clostridium] scindens]